MYSLFFCLGVCELKKMISLFSQMNEPPKKEFCEGIFKAGVLLGRKYAGVTVGKIFQEFVNLLESLI